MATDPKLFPLMNRVTERLRESGSLNLKELTGLAAEVGQDRLLNQALRFLVDRDEILLDVERQCIHSRNRVVDAVVTALRTASPAAISELAEAASCGFATCCDALGWMERDGKVRILADDKAELRGRDQG